MKKLNSVLFGSAAVIALGVFAAGCSDDSSSGGNGGAGGSGTGGGGNGGGCPDHELVTELNPGVCEIAGGTTTQSLTLTADNEYFLAGKVFFGDDAGGNADLTVEPGVYVYGGDKTFIVIQRGSKIMAEGTAANPITFTSAADSRSPGDWGGLVINGNAPVNFGDEAEGEAGTGKYGGSDAEDNSGVLKYVRVQFGGNLVDSENELNGIAFQGVGSGTEVDYVHVHASNDDGVEFFGGTVNVKHVLITNVGDDSFDWVGGWTGNGQFLAAIQWGDAGDKGIEGDNWETNSTATPVSNPTLSNVTLWSNNTVESRGINARVGSSGSFYNFAVGNFPVSCFWIEDVAADFSITNSTAGCDTVSEGTNTDAWDNGTDNMGADGGSGDDLGLTAPENTTAPDLTPTADSSLLTDSVEIPSDSFFETVTYRGAFAEGDNWADGWTEYPAD